MTPTLPESLEHDRNWRWLLALGLTLSVLIAAAADATERSSDKERIVLKPRPPDPDRGRQVVPEGQFCLAINRGRFRTGRLVEGFEPIDLRFASTLPTGYRIDNLQTATFLHRRRHRYGVPSRHGIDIAPSPASSGTLRAEWIVR